MNDKQQITIIHVITSLNVGGAERVLSNLVLGMDRSKFHNIVISLRDLDHWGPILQQQGIEVYALNMQSMPSALLKSAALWSIIRRYKPDYVQGWMYHANVLALVVAKLAGVKHVLWNIRCSLMDLSKYKFTTTLVFNLGAILAKFTKVVISNSRVSIQQHQENGYVANWHYIPNGFDLKQFQPNADVYRSFRATHNLPSNALIIGMVARFDPMKDHATFLRAAGLISADHPNVYFVCAGRNINWMNSELTQIIKQTNIADKILLLDQVREVHELYPAFDYLTQTSIFGEGFPNVVAEAMACGVECFVTDVGDSTEVIGETGYKIAMQDPQALAAAWQKVLKINPIERQVRAKEIRNTIENKFTMKNIVRQYSDLYTDKLLNKDSS